MALQSLYGAFTLLLTMNLPEVSYTEFRPVSQARPGVIRYPEYGDSHLTGSVRLSLRPSQQRSAKENRMAEAPKSAADVAGIVKERDVRFVRLWFTDVLGQLKSFSINASELEDAFEGGMGFDGSSITGFNPIEESDMIAVPDPSTFELIPWRPDEENTVARMFCDIQVPGGGAYEGDPRWILRRALQRAEDMGFEGFNVGPELEFFYFKSAKTQGGPPEVLDEGGYFDL